MNNPLQCSPKNRHNKMSCFSNASLVKIATAYNKEYPQDKISIPKKIIDRELFWKELIGKINSKTGCDNDRCLIEQPFVKNIKDKELHSSLRPKKPKEWIRSPNAWLSTTDINEVLEQYEEKHSDYKYIGAVPIDFDSPIVPGVCVSEELCKLNLKKLYNKGIRKLGMVFNLDPHYKSGSHWVSMFADLTNGGIYYFDSYGHNPPGEVCKLMERIRVQGNSLIEQKTISFSSLKGEHESHSPCKLVGGHKIVVHADMDAQIDTPIFLLDGNNKCIGKPIKVKDIHNVNNQKILELETECNQNRQIKYISQKGFRKFYNNFRFQYSNTECGVFSIFFQTQLLDGNRFVDVISSIITDDKMTKCRDSYYRTD